MKKTIVSGIAALVVAGLAGCSAFNTAPEPPPPDYSNISVMVREGARLKAIIAAAAQQRGWSVDDTGENSLRLTISQRANLIVVDAIVVDDSHYSLALVQSNIPTRKYIQWAKNLQATVATLAL